MAHENKKLSLRVWAIVALCLVMLTATVLAGCTPAASNNNSNTEPESTPPVTTEPEETEPNITAPEYAGLVLCSPSDFTVSLYKNYSSTLKDTDLVQAEKTEEAEGYRYYFYPVAVGNYRYVVSRTGYYTEIKNIYVSETDTTAGAFRYVYTDKKAGNGFEPDTVKIYSDAVLEQIMPSDKSLWPAYQHAFKTPFFTNTNRSEHQYTTQTELEAYIANLDKPNDNMYVFNLGQSQKYKYNIPIVVFTQTDLSSAKTLEEAAALVQANNKVTVHYQGQMHGDEPAGGDGALAMIGLMQDSYGVDLLHSINLYVIPRLNPDGAHDYVRPTNRGDDPNRDLLTVQNDEMIYLLKAVNLFEPEIAIDGHEFTTNPERTSDRFRDIMLSTGWYGTNSKEFIDLSEAFVANSIAAVNAEKMIATYYLDVTNWRYANAGLSYMSQRGIVPLLVESRGTDSGTLNYERRVVGQVVAIQAALDYVKVNCTTIDQVVNAEKASVAEKGKVYDEEDYVFTNSVSQRRADLTVATQYWNTATGEKTEVKQISPVSYSITNPVRLRPTAYVIPAGESWTAEVLEILDRHGITYDLIPAGSSIYLQQYTGTTTLASLTEEQKVTFANGAYAITMDQSMGNIVALLMEPDMANDGTDFVSLVQEKFIPAGDKIFPIYRYIRNLNAQGQIDLA